LNRQTKDVAVEKLWDLMKLNIESARLLVEHVGNLPPHLRMVRLSSDLLPVFTEPNWSWFYKQTDVQNYAEKHFSRVGQIARNQNVRLSFHPGQFCVLASDNDDVVNRSIEEFEYHVTMAKWMGFGNAFQDFKINVHIAGRAGPEGIRRVYPRLTPEARKTITIENEEISYGLSDCLSIGDLVPIVLDIHHNWVREGVYIDPTCDSVKRVVDSWRGLRPTMHYSISREDLLVGHCKKTLPDYNKLLDSGYKKQKLRAHSDFMWNEAVNQWALQFLNTHDIMVEAKAKNLASFALADQAKSLGFI
jgi:UV DNA damage repair endonuclease